MKSLLFFGLLYILYSNPGILACFEEQPLDSSLQKYLQLEKSCSETLFPQPSCCGVSKETTARIVNGTVTGLKELTWTVYIDITLKDLESKEDKYYACGGSIINSYWVLSAAHCFFDGNKRFIKGKVHIGEWNINTDPDFVDGVYSPKVEKIPIKEVVKHPHYTGGLPDLALLRLNQSVTYSEYVNPICLPFYPLKKECFENQEAVLSGWGRTAMNEAASSIKLKTTLTVLKTEKCIPAGICASAVGTNSGCNGDSGGPLSLKLLGSEYYYLLGVVRGGSRDCSNKPLPNLFSRVDMKWIIDVILQDDAIYTN